MITGISIFIPQKRAEFAMFHFTESMIPSVSHIKILGRKRAPKIDLKRQKGLNISTHWIRMLKN
jgi:hypothetical protein